ncbi:MAG: virulence RhuM family protein [Muribaculaceae bacterium]|nr:virulence RhuM family protein [Muribaculaceae bacterium]
MENEIILYQPDSSVKLEVMVKEESVWLTQQQIADLFGTKRPAITKHLANIYKSGELEERSTCSILEHMGNDGLQKYSTKFYNLDAILSVGYRVNSRNATLFRQWANKVLKEYLLRGFSINQRLLDLENRIDSRFYLQERKIDDLKGQVDLIVSSNLPQPEGIFSEGKIFDAYTWLNERIKEAEKRIIIIDPYVDLSIMKLIAERKPNVQAIIYTSPNHGLINNDVKKFNKQYPDSMIELQRNYTGHDRFLIIDTTVYHVGGSMKDLGNRLMAYSILHMVTPEELLAKIGK